KGYTLSFNGIFGEDTTSFGVDFVNPRVNDSEWALGMGASNTKEEITDYSRDTFGGNIRAGHPMGEHSVYRISYYLSHYTIYDVAEDAAQAIKDEEGDRISSYVSLDLIRDTVKKEGMMPVRGDSEQLTVSYGGGVLLGDDSFVRYVGLADWYHKVFWDVVFHVRGSAGFVHENFDGKDIPLGQRFYLGGINSVRGYSNYYISPRDDASDDPTGGNKMFYSNFELLTPISKNMGLVNVIFFDAGNAWDEGEAFFSSQDVPEDFDSPTLGLYKSVGTGIRWMSPFGPIRVEYGFGLDKLEGSKRHKIEFSMGQLF
ncbi:MAG: outer membrane protein assembly factor, partial [Desulfovibrionaceae bacterium]